MIRKLLAAAAAAASLFGASSASAMTPVNFGGYGSTYGTADFAAPSDGMYQYVHIWWTAGEVMPLGLTLVMDYEHRYLYWDNAMDAVWGNEDDHTTWCSLGEPCFSIVAPGHAIGRIVTPRGRGSIENCQPGHKGEYCYERYVPHRAWFEGDFAVSEGQQPTVYLELGKSGAIPEPATWAMMITGFTGAGAALRRRRPAHA